jgi:3-methyladenine DNA glycosylase AlkD
MQSLMRNRLDELKLLLRRKADKNRAINLQRFFKTLPGEYGAHDKFLGVYVPILREIAKAYQDLNMIDLKKLIKSAWHEERRLSLFIAIYQYKKAFKESNKNAVEEIYKFYVEHVHWINNWDLVDLSASHLIGHYLFQENRDRSILTTWVKAKNLWERRIAIIATFYFIKQNHFSDTLKLIKTLLHDSEDLIHKASGWMLREIGKRDLIVAENFLQKYYQKMPRTMLRYAIERFPEEKRQDYLSGRF